MPHNQTNIYIACFHSQPGQDLRNASGQFEAVEKAIQNDAWPYDNGDDPSFYQARRKNPLTWGVCRQNVRNAIQEGDIVAFISFTKIRDDQIIYRFCAVATVASKMDHRYVTDDPRFKGKGYINTLIKADPQNHGWIHAENDRRKGAQHKDWLWRIADHRGVTQPTFNLELEANYAQGSFSNAALLCGKPLRLAENYVVFSDAYIAGNPPPIARARRGSEERWTNAAIKKALFAGAPRTNIRTTNSSIAHPHIRWSVEPEMADNWRKNLIRQVMACSG